MTQIKLDFNPACSIVISKDANESRMSQFRVYMVASMNTYLTTEELSIRIKYDVRTIRQCLKDAVLFEGVHYIRPFGGRKILYIWERVEESMLLGASAHDLINQMNVVVK